MEYSNSYVRIDLDAIAKNYENICQKAGAPVMAVVKADAYGHGAVTVARMLEPVCPGFCVASMAEALELRQAGIQKPVLILGHSRPDVFSAAVRNRIILGLADLQEAKLLSEEACRQNTKATVHLKVDTGMSRFGFLPNENAADDCAAIAALPGIRVEGLYTHFATADCEDLSRTKAQAQRFAAFYEMLESRGVKIPVRHVDNSAGIMNFGCQYEAVRAGIVLYGLYPSDEVDPKLLCLQPAMSWHTEVACVRTLEKGSQIGYGGTYTVTDPKVVATIPVGYADGYRRSLSGKFYVLIRGCKAPILGRVCMDQFMVDVTDIPGVQAGEPVVLMGKSGELTISAEEIGAAANSFNYEQVCDVARRVTREYVRDGRPVDRVNYLLDRG